MLDVILSTGKCLAEPFIGFFKVAFGHVKSCEDNMESLENVMGNLKTRRESLQRSLDDSERESKGATPEMDLWLDRADKLQGEAAQMIGAYSERCKVKCLVDISPNVWASYTYSNNAVKMMATARDLEATIPQVIAEDLATGRFVERPGGSMVGRDDEFNKLQELAADDEVSIIGVYGMGGVGKTALLDKFHNETHLKGTHLMKWINMTGLHKVEDTQIKFLEILGLPLIEKENEEARACRMAEYLNKRSYVLILEDVWNEVDLRVVGVPIGTRQKNSKVIVETRIESVCNGMNAEKTKIRVKCLGANEARSLFAEKAGRELIESDRAIRHHAEILVKKCGGLPRALIAVGQEMAGKDSPELWRNAITKLENTPLEAVHNRLKRSYDHLTDDRLKTCLLYCALYPEGRDIYYEWIVYCCVGEGIIDGDDVYNEGYDLPNILKSASMLEPGRDSDHVKMHPMMRISIAWIESGMSEKKCLIRAGKGLAEAPEVDEWRGVERISLMHNRIRKLSEKPDSPCLLTLFLGGNPLVEICDGFFQSMKNLRVLDLSHTQIQEVPPEIGELVQLQYLDFCNTNITSLPQVLGNLVRLRCFLLSRTPYLVSIPEGLIGKLSELRVLFMYNGFEDWKVDSTGKGADIEELSLLKRLKACSISINTVAALKKLAGSNRLAQCTRKLKIRQCLQGTLSTATLANSFKDLEVLWIRECRDWEKFLIDDLWSATHPNLTTLVLGELPRAKIAWTSGCLQKLKYLYLAHCQEIRQLIHCVNESIEEDDKEEEQMEGEEEEEEEEEKEEDRWKEIDVLPSLYKLVLRNLPELESLSCGSRPLAFPSLEILDVDECPKLKKLPLNAKKLRCIYGQLSWWNGLEWPENHDDVKSKFETSFKAEYPPTWMPRVIAHTYHGETPAASGLVALDKDPVFEQLEQLVNNDEASVIGIHGMGGVGKTRLLKTFFDKSPLRHRYLIVWIDMKGSRDAEEVQKAVADKLGFTGYLNKSREELARRIRVNLEERNFILILDDVWKAVDLNGVGIPTASHHTKCRVIMATRLKDVCESMCAATVEVKCLQWEAAWSLFVEKAGRKLIESHPLIWRHAEGMVTECGGLPRALIAVGCAMAKKKTPEEWEEAMATLQNTPLKIRGMKNVLARLKLSYDNLENDKLRTCFLYCSMSPKDYYITKQCITDYCIGEGLLVDHCGASYDGLEALKAASMLESGSDTDCVRMHPMIRALAMWIGGDKWLMRAGKDLTDAPDVDEWKGVERISLVNNYIKTLSVRPDSSSLLTLLLCNNPLSGEICKGFFGSMNNLRVLDLSYTGIMDVPPEIGKLKELQYLNLSGTPISSLPRQLGKLNKLRYLGLRNIPLLEQIPEGLIASLTELRSLSMFGSYKDWKVDSTGDGVDFEDLHRLKLLKVLGISVNTPSQLQKLSGSPQLANSTHQLQISQFTGLTTLSLATLGSELKALNLLGIRRCDDFEEFVIDDGKFGRLSTLLNLTELYLFELPKAKLTLKSGSLQNLKTLWMAGCKGVRQLIHCENESLKGKEPETEIAEEINILPNLQKLFLSELPDLESLSCGSKPLAFPSLKLLVVRDCPKLKKLPLNAEKLGQIKGQASWWKSLEWPDNQVKIRSKLQSIFEEAYLSSW